MLAVHEIECAQVHSFLHLPKIADCAAGQLFQHAFREYAVAAKSDSRVYQFNDYVFAFLADRRYVFYFDHETAATKVCSRVFARTL
ncbi:MAG: hypothetical protein DME35_02235 [Verrucomicrobia bacterium]|nr:MAG: hypothetical protein DME35_02235 [Verrucomicrobiota bacterium]